MTMHYYSPTVEAAVMRLFQRAVSRNYTLYHAEWLTIDGMLVPVPPASDATTYVAPSAVCRLADAIRAEHDPAHSTPEMQALYSLLMLPRGGE